MPANEKHTVVLLHGMGHDLGNMAFVEKALRREGYQTLNLSYPSRTHDIKTLSGWLDGKIRAAQAWSHPGRVHFVGHSLGGLVIGSYLTRHRPAIPDGKMGRVVMLGTPHGGSEVADFLHKNPVYKKVFGPAGQELTTQVRTNDRIKPWYDLGIIAGAHGWAGPFGLFRIKDSNDGCVSVQSTRLDGMKDHIVLPALHGLMGWQPAVQGQILYFLENGKFNKVGIS